jgi:poly(glycerol-phosphate) alpha-glucosyltransferase
VRQFLFNPEWIVRLGKQRFDNPQKMIMKILILGGSSSRNGGGVFHVMHRLGQSLQELPGTDVHFLLYEDENTAKDRYNFGDLPVHYYQTSGPDNFRYSKDMFAVMESIAPDVVHVMGLWLYLSLINNRYHKRFKTPYVISPHGMLDHWQLKQSFVKDVTKKMALLVYEGSHLKGAGCIHALNELEENAIRDFGLKNPVATIPNGTQIPDRSLNGNSLVARPWKDDTRKTLLFLGRIHVKKGLDNLLEAWAQTNPDNHDWQLVIAGETPDRAYWNKLQKATEKLGITSTCHFIGGQFGENKVACFSEADAFILPSFSEGLPMAILEAWSYALPVLMTAECNLPEGFAANAALPIPVDPEGIRKGIVDLIEMPVEERKVLGKNGLELVKRDYTWQSVAAGMADVYQWLCHSGDRPESVSTL